MTLSLKVYEGNRYVHGHLEYRKQCGCSSRASGPRMVTREGEHEGQRAFISTLYALVCDECDTPWLKIIHPRYQAVMRND